MSVESTYTKKSNEITAPTAGNVSVFAGSTTAATQDLAACGPQTISMRNADQYPASNAFGDGATVQSGAGGLDRYVEFYADGVDFGLLWGPTSASVAGNNAPNLSVTGVDTVGSNGACCLRVPSGTFRSFYIHPSSRWLGYVASSNAGYLRISITSRA